MQIITIAVLIILAIVLLASVPTSSKIMLFQRNLEYHFDAVIIRLYFG